MAVDQNYKGHLLMDALRVAFQTSSHHVGCMAFIVDPVDNDAGVFYIKYGFIKLDSGKIFLAMQTIADLF